LWYNKYNKGKANPTNQKGIKPMANKTITNFEFLKAVAEGNLTEEVKAYAKARYDKEAEEKEAKAKENAEYNETILALVDEKKSVIASEIASSLDIHPSKASYLLRMLVEDGTLIGEYPSDAKGRPVKVYRRA
jgi:predicted ArsR family transcriptional regulator